MDDSLEMLVVVADPPETAAAGTAVFDTALEAVHKQTNKHQNERKEGGKC